ncbi:MAG: alpha/beta fold hydrolase [Chlamydiae bacterium]|nr:alpha/beta fold hydrolase [Chlamydiota bacterium]
MQELPFDPFPIINGRHNQTIIGTFSLMLKEPPSSTKFITLSDKDMLSLEVSIPPGWKKEHLTVILVHGLCGSHKSPYIIRLAQKLYEKKVKVIRYNLRGCGSGKGKARRIYHGGQSDDLYEAIKVLKKENPYSPIVVVGFSLGGNIVLKLAAELGMINSDVITKAIGINPAVDLYSSVKRMALPENKIYERYFIKRIRSEINYRNHTFIDMPKINCPKEMGFMDFDRIYTVPAYGFLDPIDYYKKASSKHIISAIQVPCSILFSEDDPIIVPQDFNNLILPQNIHVYKTKQGGHLGYLSRPGKDKSIHWIDSVVINWIFDL